MKHRYRGIVLILVFALFFSLCGCGGENAYSKEMREGSLSEDFGNGEKIAVYDEGKGLYVKTWIQPQNIAQTAQEVGAVLAVREYGDGSREFELTDARSKELIARHKADKTVKDVDKWVVDKWKPHLTDRKIRDLYDSGAGCTGSKVAIYLEREDRFVYSFKSFLDYKYTASSPEQIGAFVVFSEGNNDFDDHIRVTLRMSGGDSPDLATAYFVNTSQASNGHYYMKEVSEWITEQAESYFAGRDFAALLGSEKIGGGSKVIGYDTVAGIYTGRFIPDELLASSPAETGYIARITAETQISEEDYYRWGIQKNEVELHLEHVTIELVDPVTEKTIAREEQSALIPQKLPVGTKIAWFIVEYDAFDSWLKAKTP